MKSLSQLDPHSKLFIALSDRKITSKMMPQNNLTKNTISEMIFDQYLSRTIEVK